MSDQLIILAIVYPLFVGVVTALMPCRERLLALWGMVHLALANLISLGLMVQTLSENQVIPFETEAVTPEVNRF